MNGIAITTRNGVTVEDSFGEAANTFPRPSGRIRDGVRSTVATLLTDYAIDFPDTAWWARRPYRIDVVACPSGARGEWRWSVRPRV